MKSKVKRSCQYSGRKTLNEILIAVLLSFVVEKRDPFPYAGYWKCKYLPAPPLPKTAICCDKAIFSPQIKASGRILPSQPLNIIFVVHTMQ